MLINRDRRLFNLFRGSTPPNPLAAGVRLARAPVAALATAVVAASPGSAQVEAPEQTGRKRRGFFGRLGDGLRKVTQGISSVGKGLVKGLASSVVSISKGVFNTARSMVGGVFNGAKALARGDFKEAFQAVGTGVKDALKSGWKTFNQALPFLVTAACFVPGLNAVAIPLRVAMAGKDLVQAIKNKDALGAVAALADGVSGGMAGRSLKLARAADMVSDGVSVAQGAQAAARGDTLGAVAGLSGGMSGARGRTGYVAEQVSLGASATQAALAGDAAGFLEATGGAAEARRDRRQARAAPRFEQHSAPRSPSPSTSRARSLEGTLQDQRPRGPSRASPRPTHSQGDAFTLSTPPATTPRQPPPPVASTSHTTWSVFSNPFNSEARVFQQNPVSYAANNVLNVNNMVPTQGLPGVTHATTDARIVPARQSIVALELTRIDGNSNVSLKKPDSSGPQAYYLDYLPGGTAPRHEGSFASINEVPLTPAASSPQMVVTGQLNGCAVHVLTGPERDSLVFAHHANFTEHGLEQGKEQLRSFMAQNNLTLLASMTPGQYSHIIDPKPKMSEAEKEHAPRTGATVLAYFDQGSKNWSLLTQLHCQTGVQPQGMRPQLASPGKAATGGAMSRLIDVNAPISVDSLI